MLHLCAFTHKVDKFLFVSGVGEILRNLEHSEFCFWEKSAAAAKKCVFLFSSDPVEWMDYCITFWFLLKVCEILGRYSVSW